MGLDSVDPDLGERRGRPLHLRGMGAGLGDRSSHFGGAACETRVFEAVEDATYRKTDLTMLDESWGSRKNGIADARDMWGLVGRPWSPTRQSRGEKCCQQSETPRKRE